MSETSEARARGGTVAICSGQVQAVAPAAPQILQPNSESSEFACSLPGVYSCDALGLPMHQPTGSSLVSVLPLLPPGRRQDRFGDVGFVLTDGEWEERCGESNEEFHRVDDGQQLNHARA